ncbi:MAG TPA: hypothetical protein VGC14_27250 [Rhizobium sp.]
MADMTRISPVFVRLPELPLEAVASCRAQVMISMLRRGWMGSPTLA